MVAAKGDDSREGFAVLGRPFLVRVCGGGAGEDGVVSFFDLVEGPCVIISSHHQLDRHFSSHQKSGLERRTYEVTGISPQSNTVAQLLNGFVANGTLYPPLKRTFREPVFTHNRYQLVL